MQEINLVWIKRDIRSQDHAALDAAEKSGSPYLIIYLFEPEMIAYKDASLRHLQFQYQSVIALNNVLKNVKRQVEIIYGDALTVFEYLMSKFKINTVFSYQESGTLITYHRDILVEELFKANNICWKQFQRDGILRAIKNRNGWTEKWDEVMESSVIENRYERDFNISFKNEFPIPQRLIDSIKKYKSVMQPGGEINAWRYLHSFIGERGKNYSRHISKPSESRQSCGRISPYLSWGNISIRQAYQFVKYSKFAQENKRAAQNFLTRLHWHCHFIQKFEMAVEYEFTCLNKVYENLVLPKNATFIKAWENGQTGYPLVDASMICLRETGWINFRMRAMLVSFFCHHLMQDWRYGVYHLAKLFLDYEPGIHYPQFQMQAGTTGVNTIRIYNPIKQSKEQDPEGVFIKKWLPALDGLTPISIHEPWLMSLEEQKMYNVFIGKDYPLPIINYEDTGRIARELFWSYRKSPSIREENRQIINKHIIPK
ncbi:MAG: deoxyribodipyrimidine photo-lyase/cryptochrome family protein [Bacteroidota bacterium]